MRWLAVVAGVRTWSCAIHSIVYQRFHVCVYDDYSIQFRAGQTCAR